MLWRWLLYGALGLCTPALATEYTTTPPPASGPAISRQQAVQVLCRAAVPAGQPKRASVIAGCQQRLLQHPETLSPRTWVFITASKGFARFAADAMRAQLAVQGIDWSVFLQDDDK